MRIFKLISVFLAALIVLSVCSFAAPSSFNGENEINNTLNIDEQNSYNEYYKNFLQISIFIL